MIRYTTIAASNSENPRNDTANVVELTNGDLMVLWHKYEGSSGADLALCRIYSKTSSDQGVTWKNERLVIDVAPGDMNVHAPAINRLADGELLLVCLRVHAENSTTMSVYRSADEGSSFTPTGTVWERSHGQWLQGGASSIVVLSTGRVVLPCHGGDGGQFKQHNSALCWLSDDGGQTWRKSKGVVDLPMRGAMEASVAELESKLFMSLRTQLGSIFFCHSEDGGESWTLPQTTGLGAPESGSCLRRIPGTETLMLIWNDSSYEPLHHHYGRRRPLAVALSDDQGRSWNRWGDIEAGEYELTNIGCTFTESGDAIITYMKVEDRDWDRFVRTGIDLCAAIVPISELLGK